VVICDNRRSEFCRYFVTRNCEGSIVSHVQQCIVTQCCVVSLELPVNSDNSCWLLGEIGTTEKQITSCCRDKESRDLSR
jgi:hypothetical protein